MHKCMILLTILFTVTLMDGFQGGDGIGGMEQQIEDFDTKMECLNACYQKKLTENDAINGATFGKLGMYSPNFTNR